jgi:tetratricopeptide (TPR) repeat protein
MVQHNLGIVADIRGDREGARSCFLAALDTFRAAEHPQGEWEVLNSLGMLECKSEHFAASEEAFARGIELARAAGARAVEGILETNRAEMRLCAGRLDEAEEGCARALAVAEERGDPLRMAEALRVRARIEEERDRLADALADLEQARALAAAVDDALLAAEVLRELGEVWRRRGDTGRAREALGGALRRFAEMGAARDAAQVEAALAGLAAA